MSTFHDQLRQFGGAPVGSMYGWKNGAKSWFVDGDISATDDGSCPDRAFATITEGIAAASANDVIYIAPKAWTSITYGYPGLNTAYAESTSIAYAKSGLAIVGLGHQGFHGIPHGVVIRETASATTANMAVYAPLCAFENLTFERGGTETGGQLVFNGGTAGTYEGHGGSVYNCYFYNGNGTTFSNTWGGSVQADQCWGLSVAKCYFLGCRVGISFQSGTWTAGAFVARDNIFASRLEDATDIDADIYVYTQGSTNVVIIYNFFAHRLPNLSGGGIKQYVQCTAAVRQGIISFNCIGDDTAGLTVGPTDATAISCPDTVGRGPNWGVSALLADSE